MTDRPRDAWIDELEQDLGQPAALRLLANAGGQCRKIPKNPAGSKLAVEVGEEVVRWLSDRFGGTDVDIPSAQSRERQNAAARLRAAILEAGLINPSKSANVLAAEFGVTAVYIKRLRKELRSDAGQDPQLTFPGL